jgi:hypothetical protein
MRGIVPKRPRTTPQNSKRRNLEHVRRTIAAALASAALVVLLAAPAAFAKDPFDPVVTSQDVTGTTTTSTTTTTGGQPPVIGVPDDAISDSMPTTGSDLSGWLVLAYALLVAGGAALVVARALRPARLTARS